MRDYGVGKASRIAFLSADLPALASKSSQAFLRKYRSPPGYFVSLSESTAHRGIKRAFLGIGSRIECKRLQGLPPYNEISVKALYSRDGGVL